MRNGVSLRPLIIIADDNDDNREMYVMYFRATGFRVAQACDGEEAVALTRDVRPSVLVLDVQMPRVNGLEAIRRIRQDLSARELPILVLTAHDDQEQEARAAGANQVCRKPCAPDDLARQLRGLLATALG
jgi:CheY-like chemotaxis protein